MNLLKQLIKVTPTLAEHLLAYHNADNKHPRKSIVERYANDMAAGRWQHSMQGFLFANDGMECRQCRKRIILIDGQHRLCAIVKSQVTIEMFVALVNRATEAIETDARQIELLADLQEIQEKVDGQIH